MNLKFKRKLAGILSVFMIFTIVFGNVLSVSAADVDETVAVEETENLETESLEAETLLTDDTPKETQIQETIHSETVTEDDQDVFQTTPESQFEVDVQEPQSEEEITDEVILETENIAKRSAIRAVPGESYNLYCYTLVPGMAIGDNVEPNDKWNGMGVGQVTGIGAPSQCTEGINYIWQANYTLPEKMPNITVNGKSYAYAAPRSGYENTKGYYTIEWIRLIRSGGANKGNNNYNPEVDWHTPTFHLDGQIFINEVDLYNVTFRIKNPGSDVFVIQTDYSKIVESGYGEGLLEQPGTPDVTYEGETYVFDGWYLDETCTIKAKFDGTITENKNYYGQYIPKEDKLCYEGNGASGGSTGPTVGTYKGIVQVSENGFIRDGYEFTGWNTKPDGSGTDYEPGGVYQLTPEEDVLYAQWWKRISPPTGLSGNVFPFVVMVVIAIEAMICFIVLYLKKRIR